MRLWHEALISQLPRPQLLGQHRVLRPAWQWLGQKACNGGHVFTHSPYRLYTIINDQGGRWLNEALRSRSRWLDRTTEEDYYPLSRLSRGKVD